MKWFRLWTDILDDVKMFQLSDYEFRMWIFLLSYCSEVNAESGQCQTKVNSMSIRFRTQVNDLSRAFETFQKLGLITITDEGFILITNWNKRQFKSDNAYDRVKKYRQSQPEMKRFKGVTRNVSETAPDTDTDKKKSNKRKTLIPDNFIISERVQEWAKTNGHSNLEAHLDSFKLKCRARGYRYIEWDAAFMEAIRENWAKIEAFNPERKKEGWV